jgi:hypothetical protein
MSVLVCIFRILLTFIEWDLSVVSVPKVVINIF